MIRSTLNHRDSNWFPGKGSQHHLRLEVPDLEDTDSKRFFDLSPDVHCIAGFDGFFKKMNDAAMQLFGYSEREFLSRPFIEFVVEEDQSRVIHMVQQAMQGNMPVHFENRVRCKDGSAKWMAWRSFSLAEEKLIYTIGRDITSEKTTQLLLSEQARNLKDLLTYKNEGLRYARLLQDAIFHDPKSLGQIFPESFIFHLSKDIIGGDFYWFEKIGNRAFVACADCTGHGVPGAMLSVLGTSKLHELLAALEFPPSKILDKLNAIVYKALGKKNGDKRIYDGMDMSLYSVDPETNTLHYSGANNPLYIVRNGELIELPADKKSIGNVLNVGPFTDHVFQLQSGDMIYSFSDGYADQFGGHKNKKFTRKQFKKILTGVAGKTAHEQKVILEKTLKWWMLGKEQTDDVCVIGVRAN
jgi:PAS domain S-box-containing protein